MISTQEWVSRLVSIQLVSLASREGSLEKPYPAKIPERVCEA